jgi:hypothetical protein
LRPPASTWKSPESSSSAETGLSGGRGKGGVRVGEGEDQELPRDDTPLDEGDIWPEEASETNQKMLLNITSLIKVSMIKSYSGRVMRPFFLSK